MARERLKLVLVTDRSDLSPDKLEQMQAEIIQVIKRYLKIDEAQVHIKLEQRARENYLVADIPLVRDPSRYASPEPTSKQDDTQPTKLTDA
jgi:cell division topological specificity factor